MGGEGPVRLQLSRRKGFDLQAHSRAVNGLKAVNCAWPGFWGNPFTVTEKMAPGSPCGGSRLHGYFAVPTVDDAVACFEEMMDVEGEPGMRSFELRTRLSDLTGRNLACWCPLPAGEGEPDCCHAAVLLRLANAPALTQPTARDGAPDAG